ncbi:MAG: hypothetical protein UT02_C0026G0006 [Parcubacteria group bacterium GW2011_GWC2_38_7]|nr:MAG: hypothetical protein UT02_C0026G0006 [Parcubacteria group bacterium GW2011_GWC2_38_7]
MYYIWLAIATGVIFLCVLAFWLWRRRKRKPRILLTTKDLAIRTFLQKNESTRNAWDIYNYIISLPDKDRHKRVDIVRLVGMRFRLNKWQTERALLALVDLIHNGYKDMTFSITIPEKAVSVAKKPVRPRRKE